MAATLLPSPGLLRCETPKETSQQDCLVTSGPAAPREVQRGGSAAALPLGTSTGSWGVRAHCCGPSSWESQQAGAAAGPRQCAKCLKPGCRLAVSMLPKAEPRSWEAPGEGRGLQLLCPGEPPCLPGVNSLCPGAICPRSKPQFCHLN